MPALFVAVLARNIPESERWTKTRHTAQAMGATLRANARNLVLAIIISISITLGFWAISSWVPTYVATLAPDTFEVVSQLAETPGQWKDDLKVVLRRRP